MKQTWKKIGSLVSMGILAVSLTACGSSKKEINETVAENIYMVSVSTMESLVSYDTESMEQAMEENPGLDDFVKNAFISWSDSSEELGAYLKYEEAEPEDVIKMDGSNYVVKIQASFEKGEAEVEFVYDGKLNPKSVGFSKEYTMGEKMGSAALNTVAGLGTVFLVLIFLSFVISLLKYVPPFIESFGKKKTAEPVVEKAPAAPVVEELPAEEEQADDGALVAVIAAAIAAAENTSTDGFVVRSIRKSKKNNWR